MPTYEYACKACGEHLEVVQSFKDEPLTTCPACGGRLRKVFGSIGIAFKGSGFYRTDSRAAAAPAKGKDKEKDKDKAASSEGSSSEKPATAEKTSSSASKGAEKGAKSSTSAAASA